MRHIQDPGIFRTLYITVNSDIFSYIVTYFEYCVILAYSEPCHIQNPDIFRTRDIFRTLSRNILAMCNARILRTLPYSELRHSLSKCWHVYDRRQIEKPIYLAIFNNGSRNNINFLFCHFNLTCFSKRV